MRLPPLPLAEWQETRDTLQLWTQIVGKVRMADEPLINHWWNVPLYVTARGLTTSVVAHPNGRSFQIDFDFLDLQLEILTTDGGRAGLPLQSGPVAAFYDETQRLLAELGVATPIWPIPVEIPGAIAFTDDRVHTVFQPEHAQRFWLALVEIGRVFRTFRGRFIGKASPVHLFWGALDLATSRFSGRPAPPHPGLPPHCGPQVMHEAYSHEVCSCGYWPGGSGEGLFYSYIYPEPSGFRDAAVLPDGGRYDDEMGEYVLPYEQVREAVDPDGVLMAFLQGTYEAAAATAGWDRASLERS